MSTSDEVTERIVESIIGAHLVCHIPPALGAATRMYFEDGKIIVETISGADLVIGEAGIEAVHILERKPCQTASR